MKQNRKRSERRPVKRLCPTPETGLTEEQAAQRRAAGWNNAAQDSLSKTEWQIVRDNVFTFFNFVFVALAACLFAVGAYRDMMFLGIVAANVFIGIVQELRVKRTLDKVTLLSGSTACVVRGGRTRTVPTDELVLDDIVLLRPGSQVCADAVVADGTLEVNEALLTGEAELVQKRPGDTLLSGSFVVTGACAARLDKVGTDCYAARITGEARRRKRHRSEMMRALDRLLRFISIAIIPVFVIMFAKQYFFLHTGLEYAMSSTVAAIIGMIPEGLYLLVSVALAVSVISLARSKTLVHELSCIENLARVDTLCLDKTGTITEGCMEVLETIPVPGMEGGALAELLGSFTAAAGEDNATAQALRARFGALGGGWQPKAAVPFSSERKWGALVPKDGDEYILGAPEIVLGGGYAAFRGTVEPQLAAGRRVLVLARGHGVLEGGTLQHDPQALGFVVLSDKIRADAPATLAYFKAQGVDVKVISGDNAVSVAEVARRAGVEGAEHYLDMSRVPEDADLRGAAQAHAVFGRVTPQQKRALICALKDTGRTVAMIGDGVNDVLALKDADCSIAMAAGSEAAQHVAQLVLLSSNFSAMPQIVKEGRRVINNIERSATLFLVKNIFSFVVSLVLLFAAMPYPLVPAQISLLSGLLIGVPSFLLTFEPSYGRVRGSFMRSVLLNALPGGLVNVVNLLAVMWIGSGMGLPMEQISTVCTLLAGTAGFMVLLFLCWPLSRWRFAIVAAMGVGFIGACVLLGPLFGLSPLSGRAWTLLGVFAAATPALMCLFVFLVSRVKQRLRRSQRAKHAAGLSATLS